MSATDRDLDWQSQEIIRTLFEHEQTLTSTQVRETTPIDDNRKILYRIENKLAPADLVTVAQPATDDASVAPKEITLTDAGQELGQQILEARDEDFTVEDIPAQLEQLTATVESLDSRLSEVEAQLEGGSTTDNADRSESIGEIGAAVAAFENESFGAWDEGEREEYELIRAGMLALRDIVMDELEYSADEVEELVEQHHRES
ncbi:hypothetical protein [Halalkalicoccus jeotgali]|uniref:Uncharacterized protein n=1 Tax=Halalkalicoccus jeotgali (strain DSM 18796 / CECT 7217 / JCM 14584 / KCTC 4019 / B3) TaxID=795797 RepID=D8JCN0_HALJB|nr:hypothetical protein [Halalkalicoccus jeotgali]ADJ17137.1 hypothetical protein HacjB3_18998 [Halalkalicoccus jeotgali B3]ELY41708.1 hypothetical protein C497_00425 [Halalkalicoccus jeotgali B3]